MASILKRRHNFLNNLFTYCDNKPLTNIDSNGYETTINKNCVHKRKTPGGNYNQDDDFNKGAKVRVLFNYEDRNGTQWSYVAYWISKKNGEGYYSTCYVMSKFLVCSEPEVSNSKSNSDIFFSRTIKYGNIGVDVYNVQIMLSHLGLYDPNECDGVYGIKTYIAIKKFQAEHMIGPDWEPDPVDGLVGPRTKEYMIIVMNDKEFNFQNCVLFPNG